MMIPFDPILEVLCSNLTAEDAQELREERAAIFEIEAGMNRVMAEQRAGLRPPCRPRSPRPGSEHTKGEPQPAPAAGGSIGS